MILLLGHDAHNLDLAIVGQIEDRMAARRDLVRRLGRQRRRRQDRLPPGARIHADRRRGVYQAEEAGLLRRGIFPQAVQS